MQTPTHLLVAAAVLARSGNKPGNRTRNVAVLVGATLPDISIYILFAWSKIMSIPEHQVWNKIYWQDPWQTWSAVSNSFPLWGLLFAVGLMTRQIWLWTLAAAGLLHLALDFPVHHDDAHKHFWPFTDWRFHSPLSYWDPSHHGGIVSMLEVLLGIVCIAVLWRRFSATWVHGILLAALTAYVAVPLYFRLALG